MNVSIKLSLLSILSVFAFSKALAFEEVDQQAIKGVIQQYADSWSCKTGEGLGDCFTENADFVNIFGMQFTGKNNIEERHKSVLETFLKGSTFEIIDSSFREVHSGVVIAIVKWKIHGYCLPSSIQTKVVRDGITTYVFIHGNKKWLITSCQNTLISN